MKIAIVHDALCVSGGAERLVLYLASAFPEAPIYTSAYLPELTFSDFKNLDVRTLPFSKFVKNEKQFKLFYPLWLAEIRKLKFDEFDVVLSSSTYLAKYIQPAKHVTHKAYIHAPFRLLWKPESYSNDSLPTPAFMNGLIKYFLPTLRRYDIRATQKISKIATNCKNIAVEIEKIYQKKAVVIHPPVALGNYSLASKPGNYFLSVSRLISHKRVDLAIEACNRLEEELIVVGEGPERSRLEKLAGRTIHFAGKADDAQLHNLYLNARALVFPSREDFGIVPLEAQASGRPVIALGQGGVLETVNPGVTGLFFNEQTVDSLVECLRKFNDSDFDPKIIRKWIEKFDIQNFVEEIRNFVLNE